MTISGGTVQKTPAAQPALEQHLQAGVNFRNLGEYDKAAEQFKNALRIDASNEVARRGIGESERALEKFARASGDRSRSNASDALRATQRTVQASAIPVDPFATATGPAAGQPVKPDSIDGLLSAAPRTNAPSGPPPALPAPADAKKKEAGKDAAGAFFDVNEPAARTANPLTPQLKPLGRVSLAVDVPLEGKVYNFSKLKDHAVIEVTVAKSFDDRQRGALWVLGIGAVAFLIATLIRRFLGQRIKVLEGAVAPAV
jgi:tetratricopeptide (TPR) repeat protein